MNVLRTPPSATGRSNVIVFSYWRWKLVLRSSPTATGRSIVTVFSCWRWMYWGHLLVLQVGVFSQCSLMKINARRAPLTVLVLQVGLVVLLLLLNSKHSYGRWEYSSRPWKLALASPPWQHCGIWLQWLGQLGRCQLVCLQPAVCATHCRCSAFHCLPLSDGFLWHCDWWAMKKANA